MLAGGGNKRQLLQPPVKLAIARQVAHITLQYLQDEEFCREDRPNSKSLRDSLQRAIESLQQSLTFSFLVHLACIELALSLVGFVLLSIAIA